mgnify:CR=1 FL=1|jgi:uncharacterized membrane protein|tara:strand:+ start:7649 stop:7942 length:294 start_codon:yes stop_codon:yes gene_type:complete
MPKALTTILALLAVAVLLAQAAGCLSARRLDSFETVVKISEHAYTRTLHQVDAIIDRLPEGEKKTQLQQFRQRLKSLEAEYQQARSHWPTIRPLLEE